MCAEFLSRWNQGKGWCEYVVIEYLRYACVNV
uniref:Uncharacterized protein n=1 Tax=Anguilla anguilla TaxID=7936 RepID=A0A0E9T4K6_ANGAN